MSGSFRELHPLVGGEKRRSQALLQQKGNHPALPGLSAEPLGGPASRGLSRPVGASATQAEGRPPTAPVA